MNLLPGRTFLTLMFLCVLVLTFAIHATANPSTERCIVTEIPAPSLSNNLVKEQPTQPIYIYLPPSYHCSETSYPVVYFFNGFGDNPDVLEPFSRSLDKLIKDATIHEYIVVSVNGLNRFGGSFLVNSPVTGNWEDFAVKDVITYIDQNYRTIHSASGRGIAGFSMGGFAAINLSFRHPDVYSAVYAFCPGLFDPNGLKDALSVWDSSVKAAYGAAFSPNLSKKYPHTDLLVSMKNQELVEKWENGFGNLPGKIANYLNQKERLKAIRVQYATEDYYGWIPRGCIYFSRLLTDAKIEHELLKYSGYHQWSGALFEKDMFPYFSKVFANN